MGQKQAAYDSTGNITAFYDSVDSPAPLSAKVLNITDAQWQACLSKQGWTVVSGALTPPPALTAAQLLAQAQVAQIGIITQACAAAITSGFTSSALGSAHTYPSGLTDQANLVTYVMSSLLPNLPPTWTTPYICCDSKGVWAYRNHTAAQIQQVGADWKAFLSSCLLKKKALEEKIKAAKTIEKVQTIAW